MSQMKNLVEKNWSIQRRRKLLTCAEYFIVVAYLLFYYKLIYIIFPDNRLSPQEVVTLESGLNAAIPSACTFLALDRIAFIPNNNISHSTMESVASACGLVNYTATTKPSLFFESAASFKSRFSAEPMTYFAGVHLVGPDSFSILYNESLAGGRYIPNVDPATGTLNTPSFTFLPSLSRRSAALNFGDNRLAGLQYRVQNALAGGGTHSIKTSAFPFQRAECDGVGCVIKYMIPQLVPWVYMITLQSMLTSMGGEKERGIKESLMLSGMQQSAYFTSWYLTKLLDTLPATLVWVIGAFALQCIQYQHFFVVLGITFLYAPQILAFALFIQTLFQKQKSMFYATLTILMFSTLAYYPVRLLGIDKGMSTDVVSIFFLLPAMSVCHIYWELADAEGVRMALDFSGNELLVRAVYMQVVSTVVWLVLFTYMEQVMPQSNAPPNQKWDYLFSSKYWSGNGTEESAEESVGTANDFMGVEVADLVKEFEISGDRSSMACAHTLTWLPLSLTVLLFALDVGSFQR